MKTRRGALEGLVFTKDLGEMSLTIRKMERSVRLGKVVLQEVSEEGKSQSI